MGAKQRKLELTRKYLAEGITRTVELAELVGVKERTMCQYLYEMGIGKSHRHAEAKTKRKQFIIENWDRPAKWLAENSGVARNTIYDQIREIEDETGMKYEARLAVRRKVGSVNRATRANATFDAGLSRKVIQLFAKANGVRA